MRDYRGFTTYLQNAGEQPFRLGHWDCLIFAHGAQMIARGQGFADGWTQRYCTLGGAPVSRAKLVRMTGFATIADALDSRLVRVGRWPARGAVAMLPGGRIFGFQLGVVTGAKVAFLGEGRGLVLQPLSDAMGFWDRE